MPTSDERPWNSAASSFPSFNRENMSNMAFASDDAPGAVPADCSNSAPGLASAAKAYHEDALSCFTLGQVEEAISLLRKSLELSPDSPSVLNDLAVAHARHGALQDADANFRRALSLAPERVDIRVNFGIALSQQGAQEIAESQLRQAVGLLPDSASAHHHLANCLRDLQKHNDAVTHYTEAIRIEPHSAALFNDFGMTLGELRRFGEAKEAYKKAIEYKADFAEAHNNLGILLEDEGDHDAAVASYRESLRIRPDVDHTWNNLGVALAGKQKYHEAEVAYRRALALNPTFALAHNNLGNALRALGNVEEAVVSLRKAIRLKPDYAEAYNNLAISLMALGRIKEAIANYDRSLYLRPDYPEAHLNRALNWLLQGDFDNGWREYEWRWKQKGMTLRRFNCPRWDGTPGFDKTVLVYTEQGAGDAVQFVRYAPLVKQRVGHVIVEAPEALVNLLSSCPHIDQVVCTGTPLPSVDFHSPLMSLPGLFGTRLESIPQGIPYLHADASHIERCRIRLGDASVVKVGVVWQGSPKHRGDRWRSVPLETFAPIAQTPGVQLISLQQGYGTEQLAAVKDNWSILDLYQEWNDDADKWQITAAIIASLDLVIAVDTAVAHVAGAMGVPVWMAVPFAPDWRWLQNREDSPWYPTMRLFRQRSRGEWNDVFRRMATALAQMAANRHRQMESENGKAEDEGRRLLEEANVLAKADRVEEAEARYREALTLRPDNASAHHNLGVVQARQGQLAPALASFRRCLELKHDYVDAYANMALAYYEQEDFGESLRFFDLAIVNGASSAEIHKNRGAALVQLERPAEAAESYRRALQVRPDFAEAHLALARALLIQGQFEEGWQEFEWRWKCPGRSARLCRQPRWAGESLAGKTIHVHAEGGVSDILQFVRYCRGLQQAGASVVFECQKELLDLLVTSAVADHVVVPGDLHPRCDLHAPLLSLPGLVGTRRDTIPWDGPYIVARPEREEAWRERLRRVRGLKIGIAWQCYLGESVDDRRSVPLIHFAALTDLSNVQLLSLHNGAAIEELAVTEKSFPVLDFGHLIDKRNEFFVEMAALMRNCDLIITSDNAMAHLAGALAVPVWVVLPFASDWRWLRDRDDSPWYPTMRLFRQTRRGDWGEACESLVDALREFKPPRPVI